MPTLKVLSKNGHTINVPPVVVDGKVVNEDTKLVKQGETFECNEDTATELLKDPARFVSA